jgi:hypothetical protein
MPVTNCRKEGNRYPLTVGALGFEMSVAVSIPTNQNKGANGTLQTIQFVWNYKFWWFLLSMLPNIIYHFRMSLWAGLYRNEVTMLPCQMLPNVISPTNSRAALLTIITKGSAANGFVKDLSPNIVIHIRCIIRCCVLCRCRQNLLVIVVFH